MLVKSQHTLPLLVISIFHYSPAIILLTISLKYSYINFSAQTLNSLVQNTVRRHQTVNCLKMLLFAILISSNKSIRNDDPITILIIIIAREVVIS